MSKGPGRIETAIKAVFAGSCGQSFTIEELCRAAYPNKCAVEKKHRVAVRRAADNVAARDGKWRALKAEGRGGQTIYFDCTDIASYAAARVRAIYEKHGRSQDDLRRMLAPGGSHFKHVQPGGAWRDHVASWTAETEALRAGDASRAQEIVERRKTANKAIMDRLAGVLARRG